MLNVSLDWQKSDNASRLFQAIAPSGRLYTIRKDARGGFLPDVIQGNQCKFLDRKPGVDDAQAEAERFEEIALAQGTTFVPDEGDAATVFVATDCYAATVTKVISERTVEITEDRTGDTYRVSLRKDGYWRPAGKSGKHAISVRFGVAVRRLDPEF